MKSILITGGTGFFSHGLVRTLLGHNLSERICIYSRSESAQALMRERFNDDERLRWLLGDVRESDRLTWACQGVDVVFHTAALKRIEVGHMNPEEMVKTNVLGTMNVIDAARRSQVKKVLFLSSDKAFEPVSAYGQSKALGESLILASNNTRGWTGPLLACARYGNVLGSTGSVVPRWKALLASGADTVPVTDPDCTRFMMTRTEAVYLVLNLADSMKGGELKIPKLPAFSLGDLAEAMGVKMKVTGLPAWEKKHESMAAGNSSDKARRMSVEEIRQRLGELE